MALVIFGFDLAQPAFAASWTTNGPMAAGRFGQTATLLQNGMVLVAGGISGGTSTNGAELYDPATGKWRVTGAMNIRRASHTATLLPNGQVLVAGGNHGTFLATAELYEPVSGTWSLTGVLNTLRSGHTATLLPNGQVLVAGGTPVGFAPTAELYDPGSGSWSPTDELNVPRTGHTATLMTNGTVLVAGGAPTNAFTFDTTSVEIYDPSSGTWTITNSLNTARYDHTATLLPDGRVFVAGGTGGTNISSIAPLSSAELFDPGTGIWTVTNVLKAPRTLHSATLLPNGTVLLAGGQSIGGYISAAAIYDPTTGTNITAPVMSAPRAQHSATLLANGKVLVVGGQGGSGATNSTETYDFTINPATSTNVQTSSLNSARQSHTATLLPNGKVLVAGGTTPTLNGNYTIKAELYDETTGTWQDTGFLNRARGTHTATSLPNGKVLVAGGTTNIDIFQVVPPAYATATAEIYDPGTETWALTASMSTPRRYHAATLLTNGKVLVTGGATNSNLATSSVDIYDSGSETWTSVAPLNTARLTHTATLLPNGKVLVTGGFNTTNTYSSVELYDPAANVWTVVNPMNYARAFHKATLLPNGKVLVSGGWVGPSEIYDSSNGSWTITGSQHDPRELNTATLLPDGKVLVTGGEPTTGGYLASTETFDPATGLWSTNSPLVFLRLYHSATLLLSGHVLIAGGPGEGFTATATAEVFDVGLGYSDAWRPQVSAINSPLNLGEGLNVTGSQFRGVSEGSSGNGQNSSADYPILQLRSLDSGRMIYLPSTGWSTNSFTSLPLLNFPPGYALATIFVNGIQSTSAVVNVSVPVPTPPIITDETVQSNGWFQCNFTNSIGALFGMLASTNVALPLSNWTALGGITEASPGQFQFVDPQTTNSTKRFYRLYTP